MEHGQHKVVKILIKMGIDVNIEGPNGTALEVAKLSQNEKLVKVIEEWIQVVASFLQQDAQHQNAQQQASPSSRKVMTEEEVKKSAKKASQKKRKLERKAKLVEWKAKKDLAEDREKREAEQKQQACRESERMKAQRRNAKPDSHILAKKGNWDGVRRLITAKGLHVAMSETDNRGQTLLHVAIDVTPLYPLPPLLLPLFLFHKLF